MSQLKTVNNQQFLHELKERISRKEISKEQVFNALEKPNEVEIITEYEAADLSKLTKADWKKACQELENDKVYQAEIKLWEAIDDE